MLKKWVSCLCMVLLLVSCTHSPDKKVTITVAAAASMKDVLTSIGKQYENKHPATHLVFNFASSGTLQKQIEQGAPMDVFISADPTSFRQLKEKRLVISKRNEPLVYNELVLIVPKQRQNGVHSLSDTTNPAVQSIAIGIPETVPAGAYAKQWLQSTHLWEKLQGKLVLAKDVRQVLTYVESENVDAGIVYRTDALSSDNVLITTKAPDSLNRKIAYDAGVVASSSQTKEAQQFIKYLYSREAKQVFKQYGFLIERK
ncbi:molybdate ABC transporter substrate-binding protein [Thermaerobacillus caldiproteolyticus]|uniref:molybdate ABC transporter substrate-binding protein n=1 Tax=Thermaerobacillus caldiproteolyticus TaxID=247480 RepID=UPI001E287BCA|nr:molybdate ABC transporter substrate-binding protein [Anoxybacillus caldiproteolyticus]